MSQSALDIVMDHSHQGLEARKEFFDTRAQDVVEAARLMSLCLAAQGKLLLCGNGGSAADAQHVAAEFVNRFLMERPPLAAIALSTDTSILTAIGNDYHYNEVFSKQVTALGHKDDILLAISTSGNSANVIEAIRAARARQMKVIGLTGKGGGKMRGLCDILLNVEHPSTPVVQEVHLAVEHMLCRLCDYFLFENVQELMPQLQQC